MYIDFHVLIHVGHATHVWKPRRLFAQLYNDLRMETRVWYGCISEVFKDPPEQTRGGALPGGGSQEAGLLCQPEALRVHGLPSQPWLEPCLP